jgi:hypothetical protein
MTNSDRPRQPRPTTLRRVVAGRLPEYHSADKRFTAVRNPATRQVPFEDSGYTVTDTRKANILGDARSNRVIVFELDDVRAVCDRVLHVEYLARLQRWIDSEDRAMGRPTVYERAKAASTADRTGV